MMAVRMLLVLSAISLISGIALGGLYEATYERAENNVLKFKKIPAVVDIHELVGGVLDAQRRVELEASLLADKRYADIGAKKPLLFFVVKKGGEPVGVALENYGQGFGGKLGVMAGFNLESDGLVGVGITTMSETPGLGTKVRDPDFVKQFIDMPKETVFKVKKDGGDIDAVTGATISSRAVAEAIANAKQVYETHKETIRAAAGPRAESGEVKP